MKQISIIIMVLLILCAAVGKTEAVLGIPDPVPAATLLVPMFEVGVDFGANPIDTLPVVTNVCACTQTIHWTIWDRDGNVATSGNFSLPTGDTEALSVRTLINAASAGVKTQLTDGAFYHGYMTFDAVTASTGLNPSDPSYPFSNLNLLIGQIYYVRLLQGSSNGLRMVSIEATSTTDFRLHGFYNSDDSREEIDADARKCSEQVSQGAACTGGATLSRIQSRVFLDPGLNGSTKLVIFARREESAAGFAGNVAFARRDEAGTIVDSGNFNLNHVVNIINVSGTQNGWINMVDIPGGFEVFAFTLNSANPGFDPSLTWDAIFESFILP